MVGELVIFDELTLQNIYLNRETLHCAKETIFTIRLESLEPLNRLEHVIARSFQISEVSLMGYR